MEIFNSAHFALKLKQFRFEILVKWIWNFFRIVLIQVLILVLMASPFLWHFASWKKKSEFWGRLKIFTDISECSSWKIKKDLKSRHSFRKYFTWENYVFVKNFVLSTKPDILKATYFKWKAEKIQKKKKTLSHLEVLWKSNKLFL